MSLNDNETFFPIKSTFAVATPHKAEPRRMYKMGKQKKPQQHLLQKHPNAILKQFQKPPKSTQAPAPCT